MHIRNLTLAAAAIAAISPSLATANPESVALNACATRLCIEPGKAGIRLALVQGGFSRR